MRRAQKFSFGNYLSERGRALNILIKRDIQFKNKCQISAPVWAEISLGNLKYNMERLRQNLGEQVAIMPVVKTDAYGHGAVPVSKIFEACGAAGLAVAKVAEGVELRKGGLGLPVYVIEYMLPGESEMVLEHDLVPIVQSMDLARILALKGRERQKKVRVQIRVDTGEGNMGLYPGDITDMLRLLKELEWLEPDGIFTHLTAAYAHDSRLVERQLYLFNEAVELAAKEDVHFPLVHTASSPAILSFPKSYYNLVRPGTLLYGLPSLKDQQDRDYKGVMQLKARISHLKRIDGGQKTLGYDFRVTAASAMTLAVVPLGYGDALFLLNYMHGHVLVGGCRAPVFGRPCMAHFLVDVTQIPGAGIGDEVVIFGQQGTGVIRAETVAENAGINILNCESVCFLSNRIKRIYL